jgi:hypothetical protein
MDRYADRLNEAAGMPDPADDAAKMRPDDNPDEDEDERNNKTSVSAWENVSALEGIRTPNLLT